MNVAASTTVVESILQGCFDVLGTQLSVSFGSAAEMYDPSDIEALSPEQLTASLQEYPIVLYGVLGRGATVGLLLATEDAARLAALISGGSPAPKEALDKADLTALQDIATSCLGGAVGTLMSTCHLAPEQLEHVYAAAAAGELEESLGDEAVCAPFKYAVPDAFDGAGVLVFSQTLEDLVPDDVAGTVAEPTGVGSLARNARLSESEMSDILSGFSPEGGAEEPILGGAVSPLLAAGTPTAQNNLDMVLDIKLVATARLGRVEMSINEVLSIGPGSIIEVGHLVDEPIELLVNDKLIARGDVVVIDEKFGLRITEIVSPQERIESLR